MLTYDEFLFVQYTPFQYHGFVASDRTLDGTYITLICLWCPEHAFNLFRLFVILLLIIIIVIGVVSSTICFDYSAFADMFLYG